MVKVKNEIDNETPPIPIEERFGVYLKKLNGEWANYEYKDVRGLVDPDGHYKVMLCGKEFLLRNGLKFPKTEWKQIIYEDIVENEEYLMWDKACNMQLNSRELTKVIKHRCIFLEEKSKETIEIKIDGKCIMDKIKIHMQDYFTDEFWRRWYNRYILKNKTRVTINLAVYDTEFEITIDKNDLVKYYYAARLVVDRLNAYTEHYKKSKTEHEIALMTMLDLALLRMEKENKDSK